MMAAVMWLLLAHAADDALLAPSLEDFDRSLARVERLLEQARDEATTLGMAQSAWVDVGCMTGPCDADRAAAIAVRVQESGHRDRDLIQGARAELGRLSRVASQPSVLPLVDASRRARLAAVRERANTAANTWAVRVAWYTRYVAPWVRSHASLVAAACAQTKAAP